MVAIISEAIIRAILNTIDEGIHVVDAHGVTIFYNEVAASHDNLSADEVIGRPLLDVFPSLTRKTSTLLQVIETGKPIFNRQQTYTNLKGVPITTVNTTLPLWVEGGLAGAVEVAKDITRMKELSERWIDLQAKMSGHTEGDGKKGKRSLAQAIYHLHDIVTENEELKRLKELADKAAKTGSPILITGETGTGKELFVQGIHLASMRRHGPFIAQNCAALPGALLEGILFGTVKGSFTGAENRPGLFELADHGTLFLDEINSMPIDLQAKLLRALQERRIRRVGGMDLIPVDVRVITAMNRDPMESIASGELRQDLYYRIQVVHLRIPPLRERKEDIPLLIRHFLRRFNSAFGKRVTGVSQDALHSLIAYDWPGNVRELENRIEAAMNWAEGDLLHPEHFPKELMERRREAVLEGPPTLREAIRKVEEEYIEEAMRRTLGNIQQAAKLLGIPRQTLQYKLVKIRRS